ncbi:MAG: nucleotidyltransferase family protein [Acidobacteriota bacterium]|nr:nucleotidyltransferase family protein [Acidobacteriota bacterium]
MAPLDPPADAARWLCNLCAGEGEPPGPRVHGHAVLRIAELHRLAERAGSRLVTLSPLGEDPPAWSDALVSSWRRGLGEEALWGELLGRCRSEATRRGLPVVVLKGADIARRLYAPGERAHNDLDLLVEGERLAEADAMLRTIGLEPDHPEPRLSLTHWFATTYRDLRRPRRQVDLHWGLGPRGRVAGTRRASSRARDATSASRD